MRGQSPRDENFDVFALKMAIFKGANMDLAEMTVEPPHTTNLWADRPAIDRWLLDRHPTVTRPLHEIVEITR